MDISVVVASYNSAGTIADCLGGLAGQTTRRGFEVIVADSSTDQTPCIISRDFPRVRLLCSQQRMYPGRARNLGVAAAGGRIIAFVDADCVPAPDWLERIALAHEAGHSVVGGSLTCGRSDSPTQLAYYFGEFGPWLPKGPARNIKDQPTANISYKRELFDTYGGFAEMGYCSDTDFNYALQKGGHTVWFDPAIQVRHQNPGRLLGVLRHQLEHGRAFGRWRVAKYNWSAPQRVFYIVLAPAITVKLCVQRTLQAAGAGDLLGQLLRCWPLLVATMACWTLGEVAAYLQGPPLTMLATGPGGGAACP